MTKRCSSLLTAQVLLWWRIKKKKILLTLTHIDRAYLNSKVLKAAPFSPLKTEQTGFLPPKVLICWSPWALAKRHSQQEQWPWSALPTTVKFSPGTRPDHRRSVNSKYNGIHTHSFYFWIPFTMVYSTGNCVVIMAYEEI